MSVVLVVSPLSISATELVDSFYDSKSYALREENIVLAQGYESGDRNGCEPGFIPIEDEQGRVYCMDP